MGQTYQSAAIEGTTKIFFLMKKVHFSTHFSTKVKVSLHQNYILSVLLNASSVWFSKWPSYRKLEKMQRRGLKWALHEKFFIISYYNQSLIYHILLPISFLLVRNDLLMLIINIFTTLIKKFTTLILPLRLILFLGDHAVTVQQQNNF